MTQAHSNRQTVPFKPSKPRPDFPLYAHASGYWAKRINGKLHYFGPRWWGDPAAALKEYEAKREDLEAGRTPAADGSLTLKQLVNRFLTAKKRKVDSGELSERTLADYTATAKRILGEFGKERAVEDIAPDDFEAYRAEIAMRRGPTALGNEVQRVRSFFKYASDNRLIDQPICFGSEFTKPSPKRMRQHKQEKGKMLFSRSQILNLLDEAGLHVRAMILLGINCGYGNSDCGTLPVAAVDLDLGWIEYARPKTGIERRSPLWPETVAALRDSLTRRPKPTAPEARVRFFVTLEGNTWTKLSSTNPISKRVTAILQRQKIHRPGMSFYWLRHTFQTIGEETLDTKAVEYLMGHVDPSVSARYREKIDDDRLLRVTDHVRTWLFAGENKPEPDNRNLPG